MKGLTDFYLRNETSRAIYDFVFFNYKHGQQWRPIYIVEIVLINNLGFKVLMLISGNKHAFKYEKRHLLNFLWQ